MPFMDATVEGSSLTAGAGRAYQGERRAVPGCGNLGAFNSHDKRGPGSKPWRWFWQMMGENWDDFGRSTDVYKPQRDKHYAGSAAARHVPSSAVDQQGSNQPTLVAPGTAFLLPRRPVHVLPPDLQAQADFLDARAADMAAQLLAFIGLDGLVHFCGVELGMWSDAGSSSCSCARTCGRTNSGALACAGRAAPSLPLAPRGGTGTTAMGARRPRPPTPPPTTSSCRACRL